MKGIKTKIIISTFQRFVRLDQLLLKYKATSDVPNNRIENIRLNNFSMFILIRFFFFIMIE